MSPSLTTFLFEVANFLALAGVLAWFFFKPVRLAIRRHQQELAARDEEAARKLAAAEEKVAGVEAMRRAATEEVDRLRAEAREAARQEAAAVQADARAEAERERRTIRREALNIGKAESAKLGRAVAATAHAIVERFLRQMEGPDLEEALLGAACREIEASANHSIGPVTVESAVALSQEARLRLESALGGAAKGATFRVVPDLIAGVRVSTADGLIDASVAGLARFAEQSVTDEIGAILREEAEDE